MLCILIVCFGLVDETTLFLKILIQRDFSKHEMFILSKLCEKDKRHFNFDSIFHDQKLSRAGFWILVFLPQRRECKLSKAKVCNI